MSSSLPIVLVPGTLCDRALFSHQVEHLDGITEVADISQSASIEQMAADVLASSPSEFVIAGLSLGGIVAVEVHAQAPERVLGLGLLDTNLDAPSVGQIEARTRWASEVRSGLFASLVADQLVAALTNDVDKHGDAIFDMAMRVGPAAFLRQNEALMNRQDRRGHLGQVDVPVLIACGALDVVTPTALHDDLMKRCTHATKAVVPDAGHLSTIDQPAALTRVIATWLQTCVTNKPLQEGQGNEYNLA